MTFPFVAYNSGRSFYLIERGNKISLSLVPENPVIGNEDFLARSEGVAIILPSNHLASFG